MSATLFVFLISGDESFEDVLNRVHGDGKPSDAVALLGVESGSLTTVFACQVRDMHSERLRGHNGQVASVCTLAPERVLHTFAARIECIRKRFDCSATVLSCRGHEFCASHGMKGPSLLLRRAGSVLRAQLQVGATGGDSTALVCSKCRSLGTFNDCARCFA